MEESNPPTSENRAALSGPGSGAELTAGDIVGDEAAFLSLVGKEMSGYMNIMLERLALLLETELSLKQRHYALGIQTPGIALLTIVNDVIDFSRIETGELRLQEMDFDLHSTVVESAAGLKEAARAKGNEVVCLIHHDVPRSVRGDPGRLRQVLSNFISNVIRSVSGEEIVVRAKAVEESETTVSVRFAVTDAGMRLGDEVGGLASSESAPAQRRCARQLLLFGGWLIRSQLEG